MARDIRAGEVIDRVRGGKIQKVLPRPHGAIGKGDFLDAVLFRLEIDEQDAAAIRQIQAEIG